MKYRIEILRGGKIEDSFEFNNRKEFIAKWYKYSDDSECYPQAIIQGRKLTIAQMERFIELTREPGECYRKVKGVTEMVKEQTTMSYISREKAINALGEQPLNWNDSDASIAERAMWEEHKTAIANIPSENVKPVVYGKWGHLGADEWFCTACGHVITTEGSWEKPEKKYCEECGADMRGEQHYE